MVGNPTLADYATITPMEVTPGTCNTYTESVYFASQGVRQTACRQRPLAISMPRPQFDEAQAKAIALEKFGIRAQAVLKLDSVRCV